jgi:predicted lipoprotein
MLAGGALDPASLKAGSVGGQGMPVIERLLWGADAGKLTAAGPEGERRCAIGAAVAANLHGLAREMAEGWSGPDGVVAAMAANKPWGVAFLDRTEASRVLLTDLVGGVENLKDSKIALAFHDQANPAAPKLAEEARSGRTLRDALVNFQEVRKAVDIFMAPATPEQRKTVAAAFDATEARLKAAVDAEAATPAHSPERKQALQAAVASLTELQMLTLTVVPAGSGVALGFNNLDGD